MGVWLSRFATQKDMECVGMGLEWGPHPHVSDICLRPKEQLSASWVRHIVGTQS